MYTSINAIMYRKEEMYVLVKMYPVIAPKQENKVFLRQTPQANAIPNGEKYCCEDADAVKNARPK